MYRLGIDVGGTNTDCAILDENLNCIGKIKSPTMENVSLGIDAAIQKILAETRIPTDKISVVMLGTTHCTNAIVQRKEMSKVGIIRLAKPATTAVAPMVGWPEDLAEKMNAQTAIVSGGYEYNGNKIAEVNDTEIREVCQHMKGKVEAVAVVGVFSPVNREQEKQVAAIVEEELAVPVTLSSEIGSIGLLERENATILNAALDKVMALTSSGFERALKSEGINDAEIYLCQNDGTLMSIEYAKRFPILTIACGPTNSIRGASYLARITNAIVLDVGGTTSDLGVLADGFPRESSIAVDVGGIRTNFRMPDIVSIGLGGGSIVREVGDQVTVGPDSVGYKITEEARVFGGKQLTTTDIAVRLGLADIGDKTLVEDVPLELAEKAYATIKQRSNR